MICNLRIEKLILGRFWCPVHHPQKRNMINDCRMMPHDFLRDEIVEFGNWKKDCSRPFRFQISSCNVHSELYTLFAEPVSVCWRWGMDTEILPIATTYHLRALLFGLHKLLQINWNGFLYVQVVSTFANLVFVWVLYICRKATHKFNVIYRYIDFLCKTVQDLYDLGEVPCSFTQPQPTKDTLVELEYFHCFLISCWWKIIPSQKRWNWNI